MDFFSICVKVFEANDLPHADMSTLVGIQVGTDKKYTHVVKKSSHPYFNEYFVFDINCEFPELMSTVITLTLYEGRQKLRGKRLVGCISLDVATVWTQLDRVLRKTLPLVLPSDTTAQTKGFVKCEINVDAGEAYKQIPQLMTMESPNILGGVRGRYIVQVYRCVGLDGQEPKYAHSQVYVTASYAGQTGTTTKRNYGETLEWNEQITFIELFPPLFQKITVVVYVGKYPLVTRDFFLTDFCNVSAQGHLPTYGPTYVHMYSNKITYRCSILLAIDSEVITTLKYMEKFHGVTIQTIKPPTQDQYGMPDTFFICGVLFDTLLTDRKFSDHSVTFSISFGSMGRRPSEEDLKRTATKRIKAFLGEGNLSYLLLNQNKPCVAFQSEWPDTRHRLSNSNIIYKLAQDLRERVNYAHELIARGIKTEAKGVLKLSLQNLKKRCLEVPSELSKGVTPYDFERAKFLTQQLGKVASSNLSLDDVEQLLETSNKYLSILDIIYEDVQDSLPNLVLTINIDQMIVGYHVIHPRQVMFSRTDIKRGHACGKVNSIILKSFDESSIGRMDVWLWLGFFSQVSYCLKLLPPGHQDFDSKMHSIPQTITYISKHRYAAICHIFGGHILGGMDEEGLCDSKVSVMISNRVQQTKAYKRSLVPLWKETLVFKDLMLYPTPAHIKEYPPSITLQLVSINPWPKPSSLIGSSIVSPNVRLQPISQLAEYNLEWISLEKNAQVLAAFEIIQTTDEHGKADTRLSKVMPQFLDLPSTLYKVEVVFWGIRPSDVRGVINMNNPQIMIQCNSKELRSGAISKPNIFPNFVHKLHSVEVKLPEIQFYSPPFVLRVVSPLGFLGCNVIRNVNQYVCELPTKKQRNALIANRMSVQDRAAARHSTFRKSMPDLIPLMDINPERRSSTPLGISEGIGRITTPFSKSYAFITECMRRIRNRFANIGRDVLGAEDEDEEDRDWWFKYYSGVLAIYQHELEHEFGEFSDVLKSYDIEQNKAGHLTKVAKAKIMICLYKLPVNPLLHVTPDGEDPTMGVLKQTKISDRVKLLVRVYCVRAHDLHPCDANGKSDPYIEIVTQSSRISDSINYIPKELNPVFGKCLELSASFPIDTQLVVRVMDWDFLSIHDLIGETFIDIENRFYSKHRATCGLPQNYFKGGYDSWRDIEPPNKILERLCNTYNLSLPQYYEKSVVVASKEFMITNKTKNVEENENRLALMVLHNWKDLPVVGKALVPEHVETRPLFNKERPGTVQGTLEMWVDLFDLSLGPIPPAIDISARPLQPYELRVIIWNTRKIPLVDDSYFVGKKHTDIFVKGWLGDAKGVQSTDVHYTSVNGEGTFNWRFIFPILYNHPEKKMVIYKKGKFDIGRTEYRVPPEIVLQVWDSDRISSNDFIGVLSMNITQMPVGAKSLGIFNSNEKSSRKVNLFKIKRMRGWWPFTPDKNSGLKTAGFVEVEFHLLTAEEALASPAGLGRSEPAQLPPPIRPEFRTRFWLAPVRMFCHLVSLNKGKIFIGLFVAAILLFFAVGIYSIPFLIMKKILGA